MKKDNINYAIKLASKLHEKQYRKTDKTPYISHPYAVGMILSRAGCEENIIIAGILHDAVEDTEMTIEEVREKFGERVAKIVDMCTEYDKNLSWEQRKENILNNLENAPIEVKFVKLADSIHNLKSIYEEMEESGERIWNNFNAGKERQKWYYEELIDKFYEDDAENGYTLLYNEFKLYKELIFME